MKNMSTLFQHLRAELVPPRVRTLAAAWQVWDSAQEGAGDTIHIDYDGDYGSERVFIVSGRATVIPDDGSPSFAVGPGDAVYFMHGFRCTWRILESPLVQHYGYFGADGKEIKDDTLITRSHAMCAVKTVRRSLISMMTRWTSAPGASSSMPNPRNSGRMQSINVGGKRFDFTGFKMTHIHSQSPKKCTRALTQKTYTLVRSSNAGLKPEIVQLEWIVHLAVHRLHQVMLLQAYGRSRMM